MFYCPCVGPLRATEEFSVTASGAEAGRAPCWWLTKLQTAWTSKSDYFSSSILVTLCTSHMVLSDHRCINPQGNYLLECCVATGPPVLCCWENAGSLCGCLVLCKPGFRLIFPRGCCMDAAIPTTRRGSVSTVSKEEWCAGPTVATVARRVSLARSSQSALCVWWWLKGPGGRTGWEKVCVIEGSGEERKIDIHIVFSQDLQWFLTPLPQTI